jgi:hypothetical protein
MRKCGRNTASKFMLLMYVVDFTSATTWSVFQLTYSRLKTETGRREHEWISKFHQNFVPELWPRENHQR